MAVHGTAAGARLGRASYALTSEREEILAEIRTGLARPQKELPTRLFYDERGSELFEEITRLPEYYLTRAEQALIDEHVPRWVAAQRPRSLVELGAGSASKTRTFLDAMDARHRRATYVPVDISAEFLERSAEMLRAEYPQLVVEPVATRFAHALESTSWIERPAMITFLGSTIGNFTTVQAVDLLRRVCSAMRERDRFVLGVDLRKDPSVLEAAYDDARGVTAEFNLNMLRVVNHRFGADFDLGSFRHRAFYDRREHRVEMHLVSTRLQQVRIPAVGVIELAEGETIRTEISCKYDRSAVEVEMLRQAGLRLGEWREGSDALFALCLAERTAA